ncbi:MAG TPA: SCP2 sterol-binding domain-containing protein [Polyangiaceae bacterium]|nr:SCP2 sterol-binding domain-containing protein [Polyangiaceae bacterium]
MTDLPSSPEDFFERFLPALIAPHAEKLRGVTSSGAVVFLVGERAPIAIRLVDGELQRAEGVPADALVQVRISDADFAALLEHAAPALGAATPDEKKLIALRSLLLDAERAALVRATPGSAALELAFPDCVRRVVLRPGAEPIGEAAECTVRIDAADFRALQKGETNPFELMMNGKLQISGDAQILMSLSSLFLQ